MIIEIFAHILLLRHLPNFSLTILIFQRLKVLFEMNLWFCQSAPQSWLSFKLCSAWGDFHNGRAPPKKSHFIGFHENNVFWTQMPHFHSTIYFLMTLVLVSPNFFSLSVGTGLKIIACQFVAGKLCSFSRSCHFVDIVFQSLNLQAL